MRSSASLAPLATISPTGQGIATTGQRTEPFGYVYLAGDWSAGLQGVEHVPYSPNIAPMDFRVFPVVKAALKGRKFDSLHELWQCRVLITTGT